MIYAGSLYSYTFSAWFVSTHVSCKYFSFNQTVVILCVGLTDFLLCMLFEALVEHLLIIWEFC